MDRPAIILIVEDNEDHIMLARLAFENFDMLHEIYWVKDGKEALDYLFRRGSFVNPKDSPRPDLILLDLRLPLIDGHEVLKAIKESDELRMLPVVVLTTSQNENDIKQAYSNYANSYLVKPMDSGTFVDMIGSLGVYWLKWNKIDRSADR